MPDPIEFAKNLLSTGYEAQLLDGKIYIETGLFVGIESPEFWKKVCERIELKTGFKCKIRSEKIADDIYPIKLVLYN